MSTLLSAPDKAVSKDTKALGLASCIALIIGNMVGSGFYLSPASLAPYGLLAVVSWVVMGLGAVCLGLSIRATRTCLSRHGGAICLYPRGLWRFRRLLGRMGLLDLHLGVASGDRGCVYRVPGETHAGAEGKSSGCHRSDARCDVAGRSD